MSALFSPYTIGRLPLANRIAVAPMCQYSAIDGNATDWHMIHLGHLALSGAALLFTEATAVEADGRISPADLGLYSDDNQQALARVLHAVRQYAPIRVAIQLAHAGRKASSRSPWEGGRIISVEDGGWRTWAPSATRYADDEPAPMALDAAGLARVKTAFVKAAHRSVALGFDAIELHFAHGYLLHQFLSPLANRRGDDYGGGLDGRMRYPLEVFEAVRRETPATLPVGVRISASDWVDGGWDLEQSVVLANRLKSLGCDFIHVSSGGVSPLQKITLGPGYQIPFAERIRRETGLPTIGVGLITDPIHADSIIADGHADMVALARAMLYDPRWPWHAAARLDGTVTAPKQYWRSPPREFSRTFGDTRTGQR